MNGTRTEGGGGGGGLTKTPTVLVSGGSGTERKCDGSTGLG